jgi:AcrR family transcriptional regulator
MGTFYQYFKNKEQVFLELNDLIISNFMEKTSLIPEEGLSFDERLKESLEILLGHMRENSPFLRILGESELTESVTVSHYESIARYYRIFLRREAESGYVRLFDPNMVAYGLIGICYFNSLEWGDRDEGLTQSRLVNLTADLVLNGIAGPAPWNKAVGRDLLEMPVPEPLRDQDGESITKGERTKEMIFRAAEKSFGRHGFNRANISEITREAGVAQGTFYVHFKSKKDLIEGLVRYLNHKLRRDLQRFVKQYSDRREAERVGFIAFMEFIRQHKEIYRIVPEAEMIDRAVFRWYYENMSKGYKEGLNDGIKKGEIRDFPPEFLSKSLMGMIHTIALKWIVWDKDPQAGISDQLMKNIIEFVLFGLKGGKI